MQNNDVYKAFDTADRFFIKIPTLCRAIRIESQMNITSPDGSVLQFGVGDYILWMDDDPTHWQPIHRGPFERTFFPIAECKNVDVDPESIATEHNVTEAYNSEVISEHETSSSIKLLTAATNVE